MSIMKSVLLKWILQWKIFYNDPDNFRHRKLIDFECQNFENCCGPELVWSSLYQKNIDPEFTHFYIPSLCKGLPTILTPEISARVISVQMFHYGTFWHVHHWRCGFSGRWTFQHGNVLTWGLFGMRNFWNKEFLAQEHFGTGTFQHMDILVQ